MTSRQEAMDQEFSKTPGGNYFNYVDTAKLEKLGITQFKPALGENAVRIVFPPERPGFYGLEVHRHSKVGVNQKTFICKKKMFNEECPICSFADELRKEDPQDKRAKELYANRRYLFLIVETRTEESMKKGIRWWDCPISIYKEIKTRSKNKRKGNSPEGAEFKKYVDVSNPTEGRDIEFEQVKEKGKYSYEGVKLVVTDPIPEDWYKDLPEFVDVLKISSEEEMREALSGETTPDEEGIKNTTEQVEIESDSSETTEVEVDVEPEQEKKTTMRSISPSRESANTEESELRSRVRARLEQSKKARQEE